MDQMELADLLGLFPEAFQLIIPILQVLSLAALEPVVWSDKCTVLSRTRIMILIMYQLTVVIILRPVEFIMISI